MDLATILDECLQQLQDGESVADCLARYPEQASNLAPMLAAAVQLQSLAKFSLSDAQRLRGKVALREALAEPDDRSTIADWRWLRSWMRGGVLAGALAVLLLVLATATVVATSEPGDLGYPLRVVVERAPVLLETTDVGRAEKELRVADRRLAELEKQLRAGAAPEIATLQALLIGDVAAARHAQNLPEQERLQVARRLAAHASVLNRLEAGLAGDTPAIPQLQQAARWTQMMVQRLQAGEPVPMQPPNLTPRHPGSSGEAPVLGTATTTPSSNPTTGPGEPSPAPTLSSPPRPRGAPAPRVTPLPAVSTRAPTMGPIQQPRRTGAPLRSPASPIPGEQRPSSTPRIRLLATPNVSATPWTRPSDIPARLLPGRTPVGPDNTPTEQATATPRASEAPTRPRPSHTPSAPEDTPVRPSNTPAAQPTRTPRSGGSSTHAPQPSSGQAGNHTAGSSEHQ